MAQWQNGSNSKYLICSASNVHRWRHFYLCQQNILVLCCFSYVFFLLFSEFEFHVADSISAAVISKTAQNYSISKKDTQRAHQQTNQTIKYTNRYAFFFALCCSIFGLNQRFDRFGIGFINPFLRRNCSPLGKHSFFGWFFFLSSLCSFEFAF